MAAHYREVGADDAWVLVAEPEAGHEETPRMRAEITSFLITHLGDARSGGH